MPRLAGPRLNIRQATLAILLATTLPLPASAQPLPAPICKSAAIWENIPGPKQAVQLGNRTLHVPAALPSFSADNFSAGFAFHIKPDGNLEIDKDHGDDVDWSVMLTIYIINKPTIDDASSTKDMLNIMGYPGVLDKHPEVKGFDVYRGETYDIYVAKNNPDYLALACINRIQGYNGPWSPECVGYRGPWPGASLKYVFGRGHIAVSPVIDACISKMLEDFSEPGTGKVTQ